MAEPSGEGALAALAAVWRSLVELGRSLDDEEFELATECPGWRVKDQFSHVIGAERLLAGEGAPPARGPTPAHVRNGLGALNERFVDARRGRPGPDVVDELAALATARLEALGGLEDEATQARGDGVDLLPYVDYVSVRTVDAFVHEQDVRRATGRDGGRGGAPERTAIDRFEAALPYVVLRRVGAPCGTTVRLDVLGRLGRTIQLRVGVGHRGERVAAAAAVIEGPPTVWLRLDEETFVRRACGRVGAARALAAPSTSWAGDAALAAALVEGMVVVA